MNVLSLFDGMSCGQLALQRARVHYDSYYASEINKYAIQVTQENFPKTIQVGDVEKLSSGQLPKINLLMGGSPCQGFSCSGKRLNFEDPRSKLFFEFARLKEELNPEFFLLENVKMNKEYQDIISEFLGVEPILINSKLVSAQNRERLYWTNLPKPESLDREILLRDVMELNPDNPEFIPDEKIFNTSFTYNGVYYGVKNQWGYQQRNVAWLPEGKHGCLTTSNGGKIYVDGKVRKTTQVEMERLQTVPDGYTKGVSYNQAMGLLGNGWTVDVIVEFLKPLKTFGQ